jgi:hypothetical protein
MYKILLFLFIILQGILFSQQEIKLQYKGDLKYISQTENHVSFATQAATNENYVYLLDKQGNIKFEKQFSKWPDDLAISEYQQKFIVRFYDSKGDGAAYLSKLYDIKSGNEEPLPNLHTKLKLTKNGKYLYSSSHLFDNSSPLDIVNLETKEHFVIELRDWIRVASIGDNKLIILEQLAERKNQGIGIWTQLGTMARIFDLDSKTFILEKEIKDKDNNIIMLDRDDSNRYSVTVDENGDIYIFGSKRSKKTRRKRENMFLKYTSNLEFIWNINVENQAIPKREEYLEIVNFVMKGAITGKRIINKNTAEFEVYELPALTQKKILRLEDIKEKSTIKIDNLNFDIQTKRIQRENNND